MSPPRSCSLSVALWQWPTKDGWKVPPPGSPYHANVGSLRVGGNVLIVGQATLATLLSSLTIGHRVVIGDNVHIGRGTHIEDDVVIGSNVRIGPNVLVFSNACVHDEAHLMGGCVVRSEAAARGVLHSGYVARGPDWSDPIYHRVK
jgi:predicted acyltransferase (DUF342 family)